MGSSADKELEKELKREEEKEREMEMKQQQRQDMLLKKNVQDQKRAYGAALAGSLLGDEEDDEELLG